MRRTGKYMPLIFHRQRESTLESSNYKPGRMFAFVLLAVCLVFSSNDLFADYLKIDPPPDVDKKAHHNPTTGINTCWLATASNMLAGAGYGSGATVQQRADEIYGEMVKNYGTGSGWTETAVDWWIGSKNNDWNDVNPYKVATMYGNITGKVWLHQSEDNSIVSSDDGAMFIGNELRRCHPVGISIHNTAGGHAFTCWGDSDEPNTLTANPNKFTVSDSDKDTGGDTQTYTYKFTSGWRFTYGYNDFRFIKHIIVLSPADFNDPNVKHIETLVNSYKVFNNSRYFLNFTATGMEAKVSANKNILSYKVDIDWTSANDPNITEDPCRPRKWLDIDYDFSDNPLPYNNAAIVNTELVVPYDPCKPSAITNTNVKYTGQAPGPDMPGFDWKMGHAELIPGPDFNEPNIIGGFVIGAFDIYDNSIPADPCLIGEFRFAAQYKYFHDPNNHILTLTSGENCEQTYVTNFRFGHNYGILTGDKLWMYDDWHMDDMSIESFEPGNEIIKPITLTGLLPYPTGENYNPPEYTQCERSNIDDQGLVNFIDYAYLANDWLDTGPALAGDIDESGTVDVNDVNIMHDYWLSDCCEPTGEHWALIVGINGYKDGSVQDYAENDAADWFNYFDSLGYEHIVLLGDTVSSYPQLDGTATEANIKTNLQNIVASAGENDVIAFVFSGHGDMSVAPESHITAWDSTLGEAGEDGDLWDLELADILQNATATRLFVFLDSSRSGGMLDNLETMPNAAHVYGTSTCSPTGNSHDEPAYQNGAWNYWFREAGLEGNFNSNPDTTMEECFQWAEPQYNPGASEDEPMEFDGNQNDTFKIW